MRHGKNELGRRATALLASCFVLVGGLTACVALAVLVLEQPLVPLLWLCGTVAAGALLLWLLHGRTAPGGHNRPENLTLTSWVLRGRESAAQSTVRVARAKEERVVEFGKNQPPSVETVRELSNDAKTWVPSDRRLDQQRWNYRDAAASFGG